jgi:type IV secretory pathway VirB9-like protein
MTPRPFLLITAAVISTAGLAQSPHLQPSAPRTLVITDAAPPPVVRVGLLQSTLFELPTGEKVVTVFGGDTNSWIFDAGHVASRYVSIKPKLADETTDVHIVSDHGNEYTVELREISSDKIDSHFDSKINISSSDAKTAENIAKPPMFVPAAEAEAKDAQLRKEADDAKKAAESEHKALAAAAESFKASYPGTLRFDYIWDQKKGAALGI